MSKQVKAKIVLLILAFVVTAVSTFISLKNNADVSYKTAMKAASLPVLYMQTEAGSLINPAYGYLTAVNYGSIFNGLTPLDDNRNVKMTFHLRGEGIINISYRVRDIENGALLENNKANFEQDKNDYVTAKINVKNLIEKGKQYLLEIHITTNINSDVVYYERICWDDNLNLDGKLQFVKDFHTYTYDKEQIANIDQWIETDGTGDNTNYGHVNIKSTREQIGWGDLAAIVEGEVIPVILDISSSTAQISLKYKVVTPSDDNSYDFYNVSDYYRIRESNSEKFYLLSYDRVADQIMDSNSDLQASGRINLGIKSEFKQCEAMASENGRYSYFMDNRTLWCYCASDNQFVHVLDFHNAEDTGNWLGMDDYDIKLVSVKENGDAYFILYGYMEAGEHEGQTGVSLYNYNYEENIVNEEMFVEIKLTFDNMIGNVGELAYLNENQFYIKICDKIFSIDLISNEVMLIENEVYDGNYAVNKAGDRVAYINDEDNKRVRVLSLADGTEHIINAIDYGKKSKDNRIKIVGYIENDVVFGIYDVNDKIKSDGVNEIVPMYGIYILDGDYNLVKNYVIPNVYIEKAYIDGMRVNLNRIVKNEDGDFVNTSIDQLMNRRENYQKSGIYSDIVTTKVRQKEIYLYLPSEVVNADKATLKYSKSVLYSNDNNIDIKDKFINEQNYYVYGYGDCIGEYKYIADAVKRAYEYEGFVMDENGCYTWHKKIFDNHTVWNDSYAEYDINNYNLNLTGVPIDCLMYFLGKGKFVLARNGIEEFVLIYDYDSKDIYYYDAKQDMVTQKSKAEAEKMFAEWGNVYLTTD